MTTPQAILSSLEYQIRTVCQLLEGDENRDSIVDRLNQIELQQADLIVSQQRLENLLNLIIKLLSKDEKAKKPKD
jgi:hypothetical protein